MSPKIKNIIIIGVAVIALVLIYIFFIKKGPDPALLTASSGAPAPEESKKSATSEVNSGFLSILLSVKNIKLDESIFIDMAFTSLKDSSIILTQDGTEGRTNPFAPIGAEITPTDTSSGTNPPGIVGSTNPLDTTAPPTITPPAPSVSTTTPPPTDTKTGVGTKKN